MDLPISVEAERCVLGAILLEPTYLVEAAEFLSVEDFTLDSHKRIYESFNRMHAEGIGIDIQTLRQWIEDNHKKQGGLTSVGGISYIAGLTDGLPRRPSILQYVEIVQDKARRRRFISACQMAANQACDGSVPLSSTIPSHEEKILKIAAVNARSEPKKASEVAARLYASIDTLRNAPEKREAIGLRTGLPGLDYLTTGYRKRELVIISGWPGHGKSSLIRQSIMAQIADEVPALLFAKEVSGEQTIQDIIAAAAVIAPDHLRDPRLMDLYEEKKWLEFKRRIHSWPLWVDDTRALHIDQVVSRARYLIRKEKIQIVYVDYLQLIEGSGVSAAEKVSSVGKGLWSLADQENVAVVAVSNLSKQDSDKGGRVQKPHIGLLKWSSDLEYAAHCILFTWRPQEDDKFTGNDLVLIGKQRHGSTGAMKVRFEENLLFSERK